MREVRARNLRRLARKLWTKALVEYPHLAKNAGKYRHMNVINHQRDGSTIFTTATLVVLGYRRLYKNLKWQWKRGLKGDYNNQVALDNAIKWSNAK